MLLNRLLAFDETSTSIKPITDALENGMKEAKTEMLDSIATILPYALAVMIAVTVISVGYRIFKKFSH